MPAYKVKVREIVVYEVELVADDEDAAREYAIEEIVETENRDKYFVECEDRLVISSAKLDA